MRRVSRASLDDPLAQQARRLLLIGVTGSGKTTLARGLEARCGIPAVDVDAMAWRPGWVKTPDEELAAAAARVAATQAFHLASKENIQVHGGMGFTWEMDCHLYYRRAKLLSTLLGSPPYWKERLVQQWEAQDAHGARSAA